MTHWQQGMFKGMVASELSADHMDCHASCGKNTDFHSAMVTDKWIL